MGIMCQNTCHEKRGENHLGFIRNYTDWILLFMRRFWVFVIEKHFLNGKGNMGKYRENEMVKL
jgi:hypothetical protein